MKNFIETEAANAGFASIDEYLASVISELQQRKAMEELEAKLLAAMEGPFVEVTPDFWDSVRCKGKQIAAEKQSQP